MPQTISNQMLASDRLIEGLLTSLLRRVPDASLAFVNLIDPINRHSVLPRPRYAVANSFSMVRRPADMLRQIRALLDLDLLLAELHAGHGRFIRIPGSGPSRRRGRSRRSGAVSVLVCPAAGRSGDVAGLVLLAWDRDGDPADDATRADLTTALTRVGGQIAAVLELSAQAARLAPGLAA